MWSLTDIIDITHIVGYNIPNKPSEGHRIEIGRRLTKTQPVFFFRSISTPAQICSSKEYFKGVLPESPESPEREVQRQKKGKERDVPGMCLERPSPNSKRELPVSPLSNIFLTHILYCLLSTLQVSTVKQLYNTVGSGAER